ncbi:MULTISPECIES: phage tail protein [unclassified Acinetobacter]|uniref:phage tail protein n=1 Tax=unclassified Acinetobacter TaxID=196816 RepID=UPI0022AC364F|nr:MULTISPECIES: phage tail protein [unclassified Acinetobacter]WAU72947.1 phage tail protein [Acinetobacter sp. TR11]WAU76042.1 phage tail protein [Acinetobacter sp. TR3]
MKKLAELKSYITDKQPILTDDKIHIFIINGSYVGGYLNYTARLLFLDCRIDPILILALIKNWLRENNRHLDTTQINEIELSFSSEVIDTNTFDLEIDFPQREKLNVTPETYSICPTPVWDDQHGFVEK